MRRRKEQTRLVKRSPRGFALVVSVMMLALLTLLAVAIMSLSAVQLRSSKAGNGIAVARANARLALTEAIGQLQREMGPDQRVSAQADLLGSSGDRRWTGVWSSLNDSGKSLWQRDPESGGWMDERAAGAWDRSLNVRKWLVSGNEEPTALVRDRIELVGGGSVDSGEEVSAPLVEVAGNQGNQGRMAWWTGDLGLRANVAVPERLIDDGGVEPGDATFSRMISQQAEASVMGEGVILGREQRSRLASHGTVEVVSGATWPRKHFHDFTVRSSGVLADVRDGGLKADLTAFFESEGSVSSFENLPGLQDTDSLLLEALASKHWNSGPRMGLLRDWVASSVPYDGVDVQAVDPETDAAAAVDSEELALCNESPTRLRETTKASLQPILVEASNFLQISTFQIKDFPRPAYQLRHHLYPRVVMWNPYNVSVDFDPAVVMIQGNGRQEMWTENEHYDSRGRVMFRSRSQWLSFEGGRSTNFFPAGRGSIKDSEGYNDPYMGSYYFTVPKTTFGPGECLVFSPAEAQEYDGLSAYRPGPYDLSANLLSCDVAPDPSRSFYVSGSDIDAEGMSFRPIRFWYAPTPAWSFDGRGIVNQGDDTRVVMKRLPGYGDLTFEGFDALPQLTYLSASLQFGAGREPRVSWNDQSPMDIELLDLAEPRPTLDPDVRTRDGVRLRWFDEHPSNRINAGPLANQSHFFEEALFSTWNPRASYVMRSPWENLGGSLPTGGRSGSGGGPWFFGAYTRDLFDQLVGFNEQVPQFRSGRYHGNPFGPPQEGKSRHVMFDLPRSETGVISLGQLQNAKLSDLIWHPSFAIGNSMVDPRLGAEGLERTLPVAASDDELEQGGFAAEAIGWSNDSERSEDREAWAEQARALLQNIPEEEHLVYDLSYEANQGLWDRFFLSSGSSSAKEAFLKNPGEEPLPNGRMVLADSTRDRLTEERVTDYHRAAYHLLVDGAFNVNSTSVEAWKAILSSARNETQGTSAFGRVLEPVEGDFVTADGALSDRAWAGRRVLSDDEVEKLAEAIVSEVRERGPFLSLGDFVNRRLRSDETGKRGALQAAIDRAGINEAFESEYPLDNQSAIENYRHPDNIEDATRLDQTLKPSTMAWGAAGFLTQGDVLQMLAPVLSARSDTFVIRAYGDSVDASGRVVARAWCEAEVQRTPVPVKPDLSGLNSVDEGKDGDFGRHFEILSFRWLKPEEV